MLRRALFLATLAALAAPLTSPAQSAFSGTSGGTAASTPEQLHRIAPPSPEMTPQELEAKGDELRAQRMPLDALDYYDAALAKHPTAVLYNKAGMTQLVMLHFETAKKLFEKAIKADPKYADGHNNLGAAYYATAISGKDVNRSRLGRAIKEYRKALKLREDSAAYHSNLGTALFGRKEYDKAEVQYLRALELDPTIFDHSSDAGVSARITTGHDLAVYNYTIAKSFVKRGDVEHAVFYIRRALEEGYSTKKVIEDAELKPIRKDPRFVALMENPPTPLPPPPAVPPQ